MIISSCKSDKRGNAENINNSEGLFREKIELGSENKQEGIKYKLLNNYFAKLDSLNNNKITTNEEFNKYFGMATTMGPNGKPTSIDFNKEFILAVIHPTTNQNIELLPNGLYMEDKKDEKSQEEFLIFNYLLIYSGENSFQSRPCLLISVDKKYDSDVIIKPQKIITK